MKKANIMKEREKQIKMGIEEIKRVMTPELFNFWTVDVQKYDPEKVKRSVKRAKEILCEMIADGTAKKEHLAHLELLNINYH